jgi:hypothetical protein
MSQYLLPCSCGQNVPVDLRQAGQQVVCSCGKKLDVPPLRQLRILSPVSSAEQPARAAWSVRHGVMSATLILAAVFAAIGGYSWYTAPPLPEFDAEARMQAMKEAVAGATPTAVWREWENTYRSLGTRGLSEFRNPNEERDREVIEKHHFFALTMLVPAGVFLAAAAVAALWPK